MDQDEDAVAVPMLLISANVGSVFEDVSRRPQSHF